MIKKNLGDYLARQGFPKEQIDNALTEINDNKALHNAIKDFCDENNISLKDL